MVGSDDISSLAANGRRHNVGNFRRRRKIWRSSNQLSDSGSRLSAEYYTAPDGQSRSTETTSIGTSDCFRNKGGSHQNQPAKYINSNISSNSSNSLVRVQQPQSTDLDGQYSRPVNGSNKSGNRSTAPDKLKHRVSNGKSRHNNHNHGGGRHQNYSNLSHDGNYYSRRGRQYSKASSSPPPARTWTSYLPETDNNGFRQDLAYTEEAAHEYFGSSPSNTFPTDSSPPPVSPIAGPTFSTAAAATRMLSTDAAAVAATDRVETEESSCHQYSELPSSSSVCGVQTDTGGLNDTQSVEDYAYVSPPPLNVSANTIVILNSKEGLLRAVSERYDD